MDINEVGSTAFFPSCVRAMEKDEARPLFEDPFAAWFIDEEAMEKFRRLIDTYPAVRETARYRVCIMNETLERAMADGVKQVVTPGSGLRHALSNFSGRKASGSATSINRRCSRSRGKSSKPAASRPCTAIPGNYLEIDLPGELAGRGFDLEAPTLFIWEGNHHVPARPVDPRFSG